MQYRQDHQEWMQKKTSQIMLELSEVSNNKDVSLEEMLKHLRGRAFGMIMVLMAILSLIPNLLGHAFLTGLILVILSIQMALGFPHIRLPKVILDMKFSREKLQKIVSVIEPKIAKVEKVLKPRLTFLTADIGRRIIGVICLPLSLLIMIPFPLTNFWPAMSILILSLGLIEKDGVAILLGVLSSIGAVVIVAQIFSKLLF